jgi:excisionase family DNA binding protein
MKRKEHFLEAMATVPEREFYTVSEAARRLDVSRTTIWRWINDGKLQGFRVGGRTLRLNRRDVEEMRQPSRTRVADSNDIFANYDPEKVRQAFRQARGMLKGIDREQFLRDMHAAREQDSKGRPGD